MMLMDRLKSWLPDALTLVFNGRVYMLCESCERKVQELIDHDLL